MSVSLMVSRELSGSRFLPIIKSGVPVPLIHVLQQYNSPAQLLISPACPATLSPSVGIINLCNPMQINMLNPSLIGLLIYTNET